jgi:hypothetical protein
LVVPFTFLVIMPTNARLLSPDLDKRLEETGQLLERWNKLHGVRSLLSGVARHFSSQRVACRCNGRADRRRGAERQHVRSTNVSR